MFSSENNCGVNYTEQLRGRGVANQESDSPKRWELSSKEPNHPSADRAAASSPFQVTQDTPFLPPLAPHLAPGALCAPFVPQCGGIAVPVGDRSSLLPPVLCHLHAQSWLAPCGLTAGTPCTSIHTLHHPLLSGHPHTSPRALTPSTLPPHTPPMSAFPMDALTFPWSCTCPTCVFLSP